MPEVFHVGDLHYPPNPRKHELRSDSAAQQPAVITTIACPFTGKL